MGVDVIAAPTAVIFAKGAFTAPCTEVEYDGRSFLVAPVVALVPGVLNGELVLPEEIGRYVEAWNDAPIPIGHPMAHGVPVSARSLDVLAADVIGRFQNVRFDGRLIGEAWLDIDKASRLGAEDLLVRLRAGQPVEVSTGYFRDVEETAGEWDGAPYSVISRNIRPDHLALLPDGIGACSWRDGCGIPRIMTAAGGTMLVTYELSLDDALRRVHDAFMERFGSLPPLPTQDGDNTWVREVFTDRVIARLRGQLVAVPYTLSEDEQQVMFGEPIPVEIVYQPVGMSFVGESQATVLPNHSGGCNCMDEITVPAVHTDAAVIAAAPILALPQEVQDFATLLAELGGVDALRDALAGLRANAQAERASLLTQLTSNDRCAFTANELSAMPTVTLTKLARSIQPVDFSGRGMPGLSDDSEWEAYNG